MAHVARASLESIAFQSAALLVAMRRDAATAITELRVDGGACANNMLMQFQADLLGVPVVVPEVSETTVLGAAYLAGITAGCWTEEDTRAMWREARRFEPRMGENERHTLLAQWRRALVRARGWVQPDG